MKIYAIILMALLPSITRATSMSPPPPLEERVLAADHIFIGTVREIKVIDAAGNPVAAPPSPLLRDMRVQLGVKPDPQWIATPLKKLPEAITITYDFGKMLISYDSEKEHYLNKRFVFLLSGTDFHPVSFLSFAEPESRLEEINTAISKTKKPIE